MKHPIEDAQFYEELTSRNFHFVSSKTQKRLSEIKILIAGCGSVGGACTLPLARLGVKHFRLADNGDYDLTNLNRQHCLVNHIGQNKAAFHEAQIRGLNPFCDVKHYPTGITNENLPELVDWADVIFDGLDVTTSSGMKMKLALHEKASAERKPTFMALDMGFCQWGQSFDYRNPKIRPLNGNLEKAKAAIHPIKALFEFCPLSSIPAHTLPLVIELMEGGTKPVSQLACAADLLSAVFAGAMIQFAATQTIITGWNVDLGNYALSPRERFGLALRSPLLRVKLSRLMRATP